MIYLDNAATTKPDDIIYENLKSNSSKNFYNVSAGYGCAIQVKKQVDEVKKQIAGILHVNYDDNIIFTGSATEANNILIQGLLRKNTNKIICSEGEHPSVYNVCKELENRKLNVVFVKLDKNGLVDITELEKELSLEVNLICVMFVSNETGAINNIKKIVELRDEKCPNAHIHCDGVQAFGKLPINLSECRVDSFVGSAHKLHGPKGLGFLYIKDIKKLKPIIFGGEQEYGLRSGTVNAPDIIAFGELLKSFNVENNYKHVKMLKECFLSELSNICFYKNNSLEDNSPYILSLSFEYVKGETLMHALEEKQIIIGTGSACSSKKLGNRVLASMGIDKNQIINSVRISFSYKNTLDEVKNAAKIIGETYKEIKIRMGKI